MVFHLGYGNSFLIGFPDSSLPDSHPEYGTLYGPEPFLVHLSFLFLSILKLARSICSFGNIFQTVSAAFWLGDARVISIIHIPVLSLIIQSGSLGFAACWNDHVMFQSILSTSFCSLELTSVIQQWGFNLLRYKKAFKMLLFSKPL